MFSAGVYGYNPAYTARATTVAYTHMLADERQIATSLAALFGARPGAYRVINPEGRISHVPAGEQPPLLSSSLQYALRRWLAEAEPGDASSLLPGYLLTATETANGIVGVGVPAHQGIPASVAELSFGQAGVLAFSSGPSGFMAGGTLGPLQLSYGLVEEALFWAHLELVNADPAKLMALADAKGTRAGNIYSTLVPGFLELTIRALPAGAGVEGCLSQTGQTDDGLLLAFYTDLRGKLPLPPQSLRPTLADSALSYLAGGGARLWAAHMQALRQSQGQAEVAFTTEDSGTLLELASIPVFGAGREVAGFHHVLRRYYEEPELEREADVVPAPAESADAALRLREANHRIKNALSVVAGLLQIQSYQVDDDAARAALEASVQRIHAVAELHEELYKTPTDDEVVQTDAFLSSICGRLQKSLDADHIKLTTKLEGHTLPARVCVQLGLLVNELVLNAAKYAFAPQQKGKIAVYFYKTGATYYLSVQDNGKGFEGAAREGSLGQTLIQEFARQLKAELRTETDAGTRYTFSFKL